MLSFHSVNSLAAAFRVRIWNTLGDNISLLFWIFSTARKSSLFGSQREYECEKHKTSYFAPSTLNLLFEVVETPPTK